jgi:hypothetical protein
MQQPQQQLCLQQLSCLQALVRGSSVVYHATLMVLLSASETLPPVLVGHNRTS